MKKNLAVSVVVFLLLFAALEKTFLYWFPRVFPTGIAITFTDEGLHTLWQSSKRHVIPVDYLALFGDSYAAGMGDWATGEMDKPMARYGSAHLLQDATGRDVVTFGSAGAGNVRGIVTEPLSQLAYLRQYIDPHFPDPAIALVYFYEGNDLYDNAAYFHYSFPRLYDSSLQYDEGTYRQYLQVFAIERDDTWRMAQRNDRLRHWPMLRFLDTLVRLMAGLPQREEPVDPAYDASLDPPWIFGGATYKEGGQTNRAMIGNRVVQLPDQLQGPAMNLTEEEWAQAWFAFEQALVYTRQQLPHTRFVLVYIPSVLGSYTLSGDKVSVQAYERRETVFTVTQLQQASSRMRAAFHAIARKQALPVIDTTDALRAAARQSAVHGPADWNHFNRYGYEVFSAAISRSLAEWQEKSTATGQ